MPIDGIAVHIGDPEPKIISFIETLLFSRSRVDVVVRGLRAPRTTAGRPDCVRRPTSPGRWLDRRTLAAPIQTREDSRVLRRTAAADGVAGAAGERPG